MSRASREGEIVELLIQAEDIPQATDSITALLGLEDDIAVQVRLLDVSLLGLTRGAQATVKTQRTSGWARQNRRTLLAGSPR